MTYNLERWSTQQSKRDRAGCPVPAATLTFFPRRRRAPCGEGRGLRNEGRRRVAYATRDEERQVTMVWGFELVSSHTSEGRSQCSRAEAWFDGPMKLLLRIQRCRALDTWPNNMRDAMVQVSSCRRLVSGARAFARPWGVAATNCRDLKSVYLCEIEV